MDKVTRQYPQTTTFLKRKESRSGIEPGSSIAADSSFIKAPADGQHTTATGDIAERIKIFVERLHV